MKKIILNLIVLNILLMCGCGKKKYSPLTFENDFESVRGWMDEPMLVENFAHSGKYSIYTDTTSRFSKTFKMRFGEISDKPIKKLKYSVWCYSDAFPLKATVVVSVRNDSIDGLFWNGNQIENYIPQPKKWVEIKGNIDFSDAINKPKNQVGFYINNAGNSKILIDDVKLQFEE